VIDNLSVIADTTDPRARRKEAKREQIIAAAWTLARRDGLAGISLRDLAAMVELRQPSLYAYFGSKHDLYDAMFAEGNRQLVERVKALPPNDDPRPSVLDLARMLVDFCNEDIVRYVLMFQRHIPGFEPSRASYAVAIEFYELGRERLAAAGVTEQADMDLFTTLVAGIADQQASNDPGGARYLGLTDRIVAMFFAEIDSKPAPSKQRKAAR
jgi:AcrR family transcriptional regulator